MLPGKRDGQPSKELQKAQLSQEMVEEEDEEGGGGEH